jgi:O-acetylhomoserine/O-acetylserine sulfhydrylase-like pyridoxal-dependent enzyme
MTYKGNNIETIALHSGWRADETTGSVAVPIHQTTSYQFERLKRPQIFSHWLNWETFIQE